jgi:Ca2+:H+ antiporter
MSQSGKQSQSPKERTRPGTVRTTSSHRNVGSSAGSGNSSPNSGQMSPAGAGVRPPLRRGPSQRRHQYSTDDDENEVEADIMEHEHHPEYFDQPLRARSRRVKKTKSGGLKAGRQQGSQNYYEPLAPQAGTSEGQQPPVSQSPVLHQDEYHPRIEEEPEEEEYERPTPLAVDEEPPIEGEEEDENGDDDDSDNESTSSTETFTLRERQDAINTTHPFGIRIWKPAIYKKDRSVQKIAEGDIHSTPGKTVNWWVRLGNLIWTILFGSIMLVVCTIASASCLIFFWSASAQEYGKTLFSLGVYLAFPFGRFVELEQDENYLHEDLGEGRSLAEYHRWQSGDVEHGRLFFEPTPRDQPGRNAVVDENNGGDSNDTLTEEAEPNDDQSGDDDEPLLSRSGSGSGGARKRRLFGRGEWNLGRILFYVWYYIVIAPLLYLISMFCWLGVFSIPMAKVTGILADQLRRHPLALSFKPASLYLSTSQSSSIILCTYRALGWNYYKYTIDGTNIFFINFMFPVVFVIFDFYVLAGWLQMEGPVTAAATLFMLALLSVVPLAYFIGQAVASISAQSSMGMGAATNAFFATIVEVYLYAVALNQGKGDLVEGSIVGSILAGVLFLPGISMCAGAIKRKTQRYNPKSAGVSSTMLIFAIIGAFAPTLFYQIYGTYEVHCSPCRDPTSGVVADPNCSRCQMYQLPLERDNLYTSMIQPFSYICAILLFISYIIGLWFTLRTHAAMIWSTPTASELAPGLINPKIEQAHHHFHHLPTATEQSQHRTTLPPPAVAPDQQPAGSSTATASATQGGGNLRRHSSTKLPGHKHVSIQTSNPTTPGTATPHNAKDATAAHDHHEDDGHDAPNWSRAKSTVILLGATVLYAIIAEILVDTVDVVLQNFSISEKLLGITIFALVPNTTEFLNAISFAVNGNIALSMEIGSAYALQVCLLQTPALVLYSIWSAPTVSGPIHDFMFTLVFPKWDLCMVIFCVFLFSYIYAEGKSNYFKGSILILAYLVAVVGFFFAAESDIPGINITGNLSFANQGSTIRSEL